MPSNIYGGLYVQGGLSAQTFTPPTGCITANSIAPFAAIPTSCVNHRFEHVVADKYTTTTVAERYVIYVCQESTATLNQAFCGVTTAASTGVLHVDIYKNGSTVLVTPMVINSSTTAYSLVSADINTSGLVENDVLELVITVSSGTPNCAGFFFVPQIDETAV